MPTSATAVSGLRYVSLGNLRPFSSCGGSCASRADPPVHNPLCERFRGLYLTGLVEQSSTAFTFFKES